MVYANNPQNHARHQVGLTLALIILISAVTLVTIPIRLASAETVVFGWNVTGSLNSPRYFHTATLLVDGKVLVTGGLGRTDIEELHDSAELYDPVAGTWSVTGSLNVPRSYHTATLLPDGKVLVVGGSNSLLNPAELYDPGTGTWTVAGGLNTPRIFYTATLLQNGKVLVAGGDGQGGDFRSPLNTAELYDPATGVWSFTGNLNVAVEEHTATLLQDGKVLIAGGNGRFGNSDTTPQLYDPDKETWSRAGGNSGGERFGQSATLLSDGRVLLVGGTITGSGSPGDNAELYDPNTGRWRSTGHLNTARQSHTATLLPNGKILVAGGLFFGSGSLVSSELYDPDTGTWSLTGDLNTRRTYHTSTLLPDGKALIVGGFSGSGGNDSILNSVELGYFSVVFPTITMASVAGKKLIVTGENFEPGAVILLNGEQQITKTNQNQKTRLVAKKAGKLVKAGDRVQVRNPDGTLSEEFIFTGS